MNVFRCFEESAVSRSQLFQGVRCFKVSDVSECPMFQGVHCFMVFAVSRCPMFQGVHCFKVSDASKCPMFQGVPCMVINYDSTDGVGSMTCFNVTYWKKVRFWKSRWILSQNNRSIRMLSLANKYEQVYGHLQAESTLALA